jgi:hypothetical protein
MSRKIQRYNCTLIFAGVPFAPFVVKVQSTYSPEILTETGQADIVGNGLCVGVSLAQGVAVAFTVALSVALAYGLALASGLSVGYSTSNKQFSQSNSTKCGEDQFTLTTLEIGPEKHSRPVTLTTATDPRLMNVDEEPRKQQKPNELVVVVDNKIVGLHSLKNDVLSTLNTLES